MGTLYADAFVTTPIFSRRNFMPKAYSIDLRERIVNAYDKGALIEDIVVQYAISRATVYAILKQRRELGTINPKQYQTGPKLKLAPYEQEIRRLVDENPDATLVELHALLPNKDNVTVSTLYNFLKRLKITWKKDALCRRTTLPGHRRRTRGMEKPPRDN